jgi:DNA polymerase-3 subunit delta'
MSPRKRGHPSILLTMPTERDTDGDQPKTPRETMVLFGHADAEAVLLEAYRSGRIPHAWLIQGQPGIGKATLAYRMARFVLAHPDPRLPAVQRAQSLGVDREHPAARRVAAQAHGDLLVLQRTLNDKGNLRQDIAVDDVRRTVGFFGSTAGEGGWRVAIIDAVDELNAAGANALLKILEEPPPRTLLLLVNHAAGRTLPTIRSRCRRLLLRPLSVEDVTKAAAGASGSDPAAPEIAVAAAASEGSVRRALALLDGDALALRSQVNALLERLPAIDPGALHRLGDALGGADQNVFGAFVDTINAWLSARLGDGKPELAQLASVADVWDRVNRASREAEIFNLDKKPYVFTVFGLLAEAAGR